MSDKDFERRLPGSVSIGKTSRLMRIHLDPILFSGCMGIVIFGLIVLYSAVGRNEALFLNQVLRISIGVVCMIIAAQIPPRIYFRWAPAFYTIGCILVLIVLVEGIEIKGSRRWLEIAGLFRFQPSEMMKLSVPLMVAWYLRERQLPPSAKDFYVAVLIIAVPAVAIIFQPDLGTALLVVFAGAVAVLLGGVIWRWIAYIFLAIAAAAPGIWMLLQDYQRQRILTLFNPESDPLGAGWNIIQSKTAIGSGGMYGKGLFEGTQSQLEFLPETHTDFIIAVIGEELGFVGITFLLTLYLIVIVRGIYLSMRASDTFQRLVSGAFSFTFFVYVFVNIAMVLGLLPIVGVPLPLVSYGGTSAITLLAGFGIIMAMTVGKG